MFLDQLTHSYHLQTLQTSLVLGQSCTAVLYFVSKQELIFHPLKMRPWTKLGPNFISVLQNHKNLIIKFGNPSRNIFKNNYFLFLWKKKIFVFCVAHWSTILKNENLIITHVAEYLVHVIINCVQNLLAYKKDLKFLYDKI